MIQPLPANAAQLSKGEQNRNGNEQESTDRSEWGRPGASRGDQPEVASVLIGLDCCKELKSYYQSTLILFA